MAKRKTKKAKPEVIPTEDAEGLAVGHSPRPQLSATDQRLFQSFQANLLSLISHELRTPLTGILNSLSLLDEVDTSSDFSADELIAMARRNAVRLHETLATLLDLAALESGAFHPRLREVDLENLVQARIRVYERLANEHGIQVQVDRPEKNASPVLADPQKLGRAVELCFQLIVPRCAPEAMIEVRVQPRKIVLSFELNPLSLQEFESAWLQALAGYEGGVVSPASAFSGALQSEEGFLARTQEGLGSEFMLIHEIMRVHRGVFSKKDTKEHVQLTLELPELSSNDALRSVISSRVYQTSTGLGTVALALIQVPKNESVEEFRGKVKKCLFRATDAIYLLPDRHQVALVMDDCKMEDAPHLMKRIERAMGEPLSVGIAVCPDESSDPDLLIEMAEKRLRPAD